MTIDIHHGDCREVMATLDAESVDAIVCDPPYGLSFMGKGWDHGVPGVEFWTEALRVAKPGAHLLAFGGTRTYHRLACAIEDAGWEIRDCIMWCFGSGFPKSHDVSKAIDKRGGNAHLTAEIGAALRAARKARGISATEADRTYCGGVTLWSWYEGRPAGQQLPAADVMAKVAADWPELRQYADLVAEAEREVVRQQQQGRLAVAPGQDNDRSSKTLDITAPATDAARQWSGWGTALKPAYEPVIVARKPLVGTVAENVLTHGTGAINVDGCRVGTEDDCARKPSLVHDTAAGFGKGAAMGGRGHDAGRWPANLIHDGSEEVVGLFPETLSSKRKPCHEKGRTHGACYGSPSGSQYASTHGDSGSAARFFYCAKASKADRDEGCEGLAEKLVVRMATQNGTSDTPSKAMERFAAAARNHHPTVKPTALMRYLCRLVTPPGGVVLDPFTGSGSTGKGAILEGFRFIGIEREAEYVEIAKARIAAAVQKAEAVA